MNISQSLSSLSSWSSQLSSSSSLLPTNNYNPLVMLPIASTGGIQPFLIKDEPTQQDIYTNEQINLSLQFQYQQLANAIDFSNNNNNNMNDKNSSLFQLNRRPITGFNNSNRAAKNKFKTNHQISACQPFMSPVLASPSGKYSRKVFVGGLPPDIDESKFFFLSYL